MDREKTTLLRAPEVAARLALGRSMVYRLMAEGCVPTVRIGRAVRVPSGALEDWITHQIRLPPEEPEERDSEARRDPAGNEPQACAIPAASRTRN